ncbi:CD83 antigen-like isoform X2 [Mustelus asterias]
MEFLSGCRLQRSIFLMLQPVLFYSAEAITDVFIRLGEIAKLPCDASCVSEVEYRAVSWYKVADDGFSLSGIVRRDFKENISREYLGFDGSVEVTSTSPYFLTIHNISGKDLGTYRCSIWAPLGERNKQADVRLLKVVDYKSEGITSIVLVSIVTTSCVALILFLYLVHRRHSRTMETFAKQKSKKIKNYSQPFGDRLLLYSNI